MIGYIRFWNLQIFKSYWSAFLPLFWGDVHLSWCMSLFYSALYTLMPTLSFNAGFSNMFSQSLKKVTVLIFLICILSKIFEILYSNFLDYLKSRSFLIARASRISDTQGKLVTFFSISLIHEWWHLIYWKHWPGMTCVTTVPLEFSFSFYSFKPERSIFANAPFFSSYPLNGAAILPTLFTLMLMTQLSKLSLISNVFPVLYLELFLSFNFLIILLKILTAFPSGLS